MNHVWNTYCTVHKRKDLYVKIIISGLYESIRRPRCLFEATWQSTQRTEKTIALRKFLTSKATQTHFWTSLKHITGLLVNSSPSVVIFLTRSAWQFSGTPITPGLLGVRYVSHNSKAEERRLSITALEVRAESGEVKFKIDSGIRWYLERESPT